MRDGKRFKISEDSVKAFYEAHKSELLTEIPLVKGIYLKVASSSRACRDSSAYVRRER